MQGMGFSYDSKVVHRVGDAEKWIPEQGEKIA